MTLGCDHAELSHQANEVFRRAQRRSCLSWNDDDQRAALSELCSLDAAIVAARDRAREERQESLANSCLAIACIGHALQAELRLWLAAKARDYEAAWNELTNARDSALAALRAHEAAATVEARLELYDILEATLFPPQMFSSIGCLSLVEECSLCRAPYAECDHVAGKPYMGELCSRVVKEAQLLEVSIVPNPVDRRCRITSHTIVDGICRDTLTGAPVPPPADKSA